MWKGMDVLVLQTPNFYYAQDRVFSLEGTVMKLLCDTLFTGTLISTYPWVIMKL